MEEILPNLYRVIVPLPRNPLKEINSWILTSDDRNLIIDTGMNRPECIEVLQPALDEIGLNMEKTDLIATHLHADHFGLVGTLATKSSTVYMGAGDAGMMNTGSGWVMMTEFATLTGFSKEEAEAALKMHPGARFGPSSIPDITPFHDGDTLSVGDYFLQGVETPGHTPGHMCLYEPNKKILFSGDHILGDITPNIQAWSNIDDPLDYYINSLNKVSKLEMKIVLPGHRSIIADGPKRIKELIEHHRVRANEVLSILEKGDRNAYQTAAEMTWDIKADSWDDFPVSQKWFAVGEAIAHIRYLEGKKLVQSETIDGQIIYSANEVGVRL